MAKPRHIRRLDWYTGGAQCLLGIARAVCRHHIVGLAVYQQDGRAVGQFGDAGR
jgi:hypothetical protein